MRIFRRRGTSLSVLLVAIFIVCFVLLRLPGHRVPRLEFIDSAIHAASERFNSFHTDGTGGWVTRWFRGRPPTFPLVVDSNVEPRCPVYTYFTETKSQRDSDDAKVLAAWKRAFWSLGFDPVVLTEKDARKHPRQPVFHQLDLMEGSRAIVYGKWLAMAQFGGLFVDYRTFPMPTPGDATIPKLRQCQYTALTIYESMEEHICHGDKAAYEALVQALVDNPSGLRTASHVHERFPSQFNVAPALSSFSAYHDVDVSKYSHSLNIFPLSSLINIHLHEHFLRTHNTLAIIHPPEPQPAIFRTKSEALAEVIAQCPTGPFAGFCPPGSIQCKPCKPATVGIYRSLASLPKNSFVFVTLPHPYSVAVEKQHSLTVDSRTVRDIKRDEWIEVMSDGLLGRHAGGYQRAQALKGIVNRPYNGIWQVWEEFSAGSLPWILGFEIGDNKWSEVKDKAVSTDNELLIAARQQVLSHTSERARDIVELWHLAWTELWYFVRAAQCGAGNSR